ncbi:MAG: GntR family transcriptional regulator [Solirubrobacteraceae bacterium]
MSDISAIGVASVSRTLLAERAYEELRDRLVTLQIKPGEPIDEDLIRQQLRMGRTPIREAIKRLALENLVNVFPRRGTFAAEINITDLADITDVRSVLEGHAAFLAAQRLTPARALELAVLAAEVTASRGSDDTAALMALDTRVHRFIYAAAANPLLAETLLAYYNLSVRIWYLVIDRVPQLFARVHEHADLLDAIANGRAELAREIVTVHVATFEREVRSVL